MPQRETVYRYFRADASTDISGNTVSFSVDGGETFPVDGVFVAFADLPSGVVEVHDENPTAAAWSWWRILTGPNNTPLDTGLTVVIARTTDNPEIPWFWWTVIVDVNE